MMGYLLLESVCRRDVDVDIVMNACKYRDTSMK